MKLSSFKTLLVVAMVVLVVLPVMACAPKAPPSPPPPPPAPPAGTISVEPPEIKYDTIYGAWPAVAAALGFPAELVPKLNPAIAVLGIPINFVGSGWQPNELVTIELVIPPDVELKGLDRARGEDSVGVAFTTTDADGSFKVPMEVRFAKLNWLLQVDYAPRIAAKWDTVNPIPNGTYTVKAVGEDPRSVATTTWYLELNPPPGWQPPAAKSPAEKPPAELGELSFEAAEYSN